MLGPSYIYCQKSKTIRYSGGKKTWSYIIPWSVETNAINAFFIWKNNPYKPGFNFFFLLYPQIKKKSYTHQLRCAKYMQRLIHTKITFLWNTNISHCSPFFHELDCVLISGIWVCYFTFIGEILNNRNRIKHVPTPLKNVQGVRTDEPTAEFLFEAEKFSPLVVFGAKHWSAWMCIPIENRLYYL